MIFITLNKPKQMKKSRLGIIGTAMMMGAMVSTPASIANANTPAQQTQTNVNSKAVKPESKKHNRKTVHQAGGLDLEHEFTKLSIPPLQYAISNGSSGGVKKSNRLRIKHNAKLKRRIS